MLISLIARLSASQNCKRRTHLGLLLRDASRIFNSFSSDAKSSESNQLKQKHEADESFTVSYLRNSLGLSPKVAIAVSKRVDFKTPRKPDSVLNIFRSYGFSDAQISKIVTKYPPLLLIKPETNLSPKLSFFQSIGFSSSELLELLILNCKILAWSLKNRIIPYYEALKSVLDEDEKVKAVIKRSGWSAAYKFDVKNMVPNIKLLKDLGMPQSSVIHLLKISPSTAFTNHERFVVYVNFTKQIGIQPFKTMFIQAIKVLSHVNQSTWNSKLDMFEKCGWSRDVTLSAFTKFPICMQLSEEKITKTMKFLVDEMGFPLEEIAGCPTILGYSLKQRIIPRWSLVKILKMKGLIKNNVSIPSIIIMSEKRFLEKFVIGFQKSVPHILKIYRAESTPPKE